MLEWDDVTMTMETCDGRGLGALNEVGFLPGNRAILQNEYCTNANPAHLCRTAEISLCKTSFIVSRNSLIVSLNCLELMKKPNSKSEYFQQKLGTHSEFVILPTSHLCNRFSSTAGASSAVMMTKPNLRKDPYGSTLTSLKLFSVMTQSRSRLSHTQRTGRVNRISERPIR